jgi:hypothetical protein
VSVNQNDQPFIAVLRLCLLLALLSPPLLVAAGSFKLGEQLDYTVTYRGILSAWQPLDIAQAALVNEPQLQEIDGKTVFSAKLVVTTQAYDQAEQFYPIRYTFQSWFEPTAQYALLVDEMGREKGFKQTLLWFDQKKEHVHRFKRSDDKLFKKEILPPFLRLQYRLDNGLSGFRKKSGNDLKSGTLDHLSTLYRMRLVELKSGDVLDLPASDGKDLMGYRVEVIGKEPLLQGSNDRMTTKVKFVPQDRDEGSLDAIYVWYALDESRTPMLFYSSRFFGDISISLNGQRVGDHWHEKPTPQPSRNFNILDFEG